MTMVRAVEFPGGTDVTPVRDILDFHNIQYRVVEEGEAVVLYVAGDTDRDRLVELLREAVSAMERDRLGQLRPHPAAPSLQLAQFPVTLVLLVLSILGALIPHWGFPLLHWLTFQDFQLLSATEIVFSSAPQDLAAGQLWRLVTPIFLHFGVFHIVFNGLWLWEFGRRIEQVIGGGHLLMLVLVIGLVSNMGQYWWSGPSLFGGMSGVIFGLLGYLWVRNGLAPHPVLALPTGIIVLMIGWLLICMTGFVDLFFQGSIANAAHAAGLAAGMALGAIFGLARRR